MSAAYIDNPRAGGASIPGVLDPTDTPVVEGWTATLAPGQGLRILVDVLAPPDPATATPREAGRQGARRDEHDDAHHRQRHAAAR